MSRRRRMPEYIDNHERWLVSYADFITLMFAFFVVLYSTSRVSSGNFRAMSDSVMQAFDLPRESQDVSGEGDQPRSLLPDEQQSQLTGENPMMSPLRRAGDGDGSGDVGAAMTESGRDGINSNNPDGNDQRAVEEVTAIATALESSVGELVAPDTVGIRRNATWVELEIPAQMIFPSGSQVFLNSAIPLLESIAGALRGLPNEIAVEAHTDSQPIRTGRFPTNWELSSAQAVTVAKLLVDMGVDPARVSATGFAQYRPVADNDTTDGREANRRLVLSIKTGSPANTAELRRRLGVAEDAGADVREGGGDG